MPHNPHRCIPEHLWEGRLYPHSWDLLWCITGLAQPTEGKGWRGKRERRKKGEGGGKWKGSEGRKRESKVGRKQLPWYVHLKNHCNSCQAGGDGHWVYACSFRSIFVHTLAVYPLLKWTIYLACMLIAKFCGSKFWKQQFESNCLKWVRSRLECYLVTVGIIC